MASNQDGEGLGKRTARVLSAVLIGQILSIIITGITIILLARLLEPTSYGAYTFAFGYASFIDAVGGFGIGAYLSRHFSIFSYRRDKEKMMRVLSSGLFLFMVSSVLITLLALSLSGYLSNTLYAGLGIPEITLITASLMIFFVMMQSVSMQALIGLGKGAFSSFTGVIGNAVQLVGSVGLVLYGFGVEGALAGMLAGYVVSAAAGACFVCMALREYGPIRLNWPRKDELKETAGFSFPIGLNYMLNDGMQNFSILFLGFYVSKAVLGNYGAALKALAAVILLHNSINNVLLPAFSRAKIEKAREALHQAYNRILGYSLVLILPLLVYVAVFSKPAVFLFLSNSYASAPQYLSLIIVGAIINTVSLFISNLIISRGKTLKVLKYNSVVAVVEVALLAILTPWLSAYGLAVYAVIFSIFIAGSVVAIYLFIHGAGRLFGVRFDRKRIYHIFASNILLAITLAAVLFALNYVTAGSIRNSVMGIELVIGLAAALLVYPAIIVLTRTLDRSDIESIGRSTERLPVISGIVKRYMRYTELFLG